MASMHPAPALILTAFNAYSEGVCGVRRLGGVGLGVVWGVAGVVLGFGMGFPKGFRKGFEYFEALRL